MKILITSGPTRQYLDPVRYLTNASSGRMGCALAAAAIQLGHEVTIISGPVSLTYPAEAEVISVVTTDQMLEECRKHFPKCNGLIGAAAPCDYRPQKVADHKIAKTGAPLTIELVETVDIVATMSQQKRADQWVVGFALETQDARFRALAKLQRKACDLVVVNSPQAIDADDNDVEIIDPLGQVISSARGPKSLAAREILSVIERRLSAPADSQASPQSVPK